MRDLETVLAKLERQGLPERGFWEDDLEMAVDDALRPALEVDGHLDDWIGGRTGYQTAVLCRHLGIDGDLSVQKQRPALLDRGEALLPFVLVERFGKGKSRVAVAGVAKDKLPADLVETCRKYPRGHEDEEAEDGDDGDGEAEDKIEAEERYDTLALLFALYKTDPMLLRLVFHSDKVQRTGFARMALATEARRPNHSLGTVLRREKLTKILREFDGSVKDGRRSDLKDVVSNEGRFLVFIRRPERPVRMLGPDDGHVRHGYYPEWIVLDFEEGAKRVKISSRSNDVPLEIANRIASAYFEKHCEYVNEEAVTYGKQVERFLKALTAAPMDGLSLAEILLRASPLPGAVGLRLSGKGPEPIGPAITGFGEKVGSLLDEVAPIESVKVHYRRKRVSLIFDAVEGKPDEYIVRYSDQRLNGFERSPFEDHMRDTHGIHVLSTEKRTKRRRR